MQVKKLSENKVVVDITSLDMNVHLYECCSLSFLQCLFFLCHLSVFWPHGNKSVIV